MKRLVIMVDDVARLRHVFGDSQFDPARFGLLAEVAGAHGVAATLTNNKQRITEKDVQLLKHLRNTFLNIHIPMDSQIIKKTLSIRPEMVTIVDIPSVSDLSIRPVIPETLMDLLPDVIADFQANNISVALFISPEINLLKQISKLPVDYVELDCTEMTHASDSNEYLVALDKINSATLAAAKLGLGVNCIGDIDFSHLPELAAIPHLEDICMDLSILKRSLLVGVSRAVGEALQQLLAFQK